MRRCKLRNDIKWQRALNQKNLKGMKQDLGAQVKLKVKFTLEQAKKAQRGSRCIALIFFF
jgi:hypothetical protein